MPLVPGPPVTVTKTPLRVFAFARWRAKVTSSVRPPDAKWSRGTRMVTQVKIESAQGICRTTVVA